MNTSEKLRDLVKLVVVFGLLVFYVTLNWQMYDMIICLDGLQNIPAPSPNLNCPKEGSLDSLTWTSNHSDYLTAVTLLLATVVAAELAITPPSGKPGRGLLGIRWAVAKPFITIVASLYIIIWLITGGILFYTGMLVIREEVRTALPVIEQLGSSYWALVLAISYAYFGIEPPSS